MNAHQNTKNRIHEELLLKIQKNTENAMIEAKNLNEKVKFDIQGQINTEKSNIMEKLSGSLVEDVKQRKY